MTDVATLGDTVQSIRNIAIGGVVFFSLVGLDILIGGRVMSMLGKIFNKKFDFDNIVLMGLSGFRKGSEKKVMNVDEALLKARARIFIGVMLLIPAVLLAVLVLVRR